MTNDDQKVETERAINRARAYAVDAWNATREEAEARFTSLLDRAERAWRGRSGGVDRSLRRPLAAVAIIGAAVGLGIYLSRRHKAEAPENEPVDAV